MKKGDCKKILILAVDCDTTNILYNYLSNDFEISKIIIEEKIPTLSFLKRRIKKLGITKVIGQILFILLITKPQRLFSKKRVKEILKQFELTNTPIPYEKKIMVSSVNDIETMNLLKKESPTIVIVNGTRILSENMLTSIKASFINIHTGITPLYRGVHGGYWALVMGDSAHFGVTIHKVDKGIDTGKILKQGVINPSKYDNFSTYPYLQYAKGCELFKQVLSGELNETVSMANKSCLWSHPTLWEYIKYRIKRNVK